MAKLFVVECRSTYVIEADDYDSAFDELQEIDRYGTEVFESELMREATVSNVSKNWAECEPSNKLDGRKLKEIAPELFGQKT